MHRTALIAIVLTACVDPADTGVLTDPGTQIGEEGDDLRCIEVRDVVDVTSTPSGTLDVAPDAFIALAEVPVSGSLTANGVTETLTLTLTHTGRVWYAHEEPRDAEVDPSECNMESYYAEVDGTLVAGDLLNESFSAEAWSFQSGHVYVGARFDISELNGTLEPARIDPDAWDEVTLHAFGGSTDGVWAFHIDWDGEMDDSGESEREDVADISLHPQGPTR